MEPVNSTANASVQGPALAIPGAIRYVAVTLYLTTFVLGVTGNTLTILVIVCIKKISTVASVFILNLAIADALFMLSLPFMAHSSLIGEWVFGSVLCKMMTAFYGTNLYASILTMVLVSVDRLLAIGFPLQSRRYRTVRNAATVCILIWVICAVLMMPYWIYADIHPVSSSCGTQWPKSTRLQHVWFWANFELIMGFAAPIVVMVICYSSLLRHIMKSRESVQTQAKSPVRRVTLMLFIVTIVFIICWTPYHITQYTSIKNTVFYARNRIIPPKDRVVRFVILNTVAQALVFVSSCCNPIIYGISSNSFRRQYFDLIMYCCRKRSSSDLGSARSKKDSLFPLEEMRQPILKNRPSTCPSEASRGSVALSELSRGSVVLYPTGYTPNNTPQTPL